MVLGAMLSLSIYGLATLLRFSKTQAGFAALIFLTFPIVILQSGTAQNDILTACFFLAGLYFFISGFQLSNRLALLFSAIGMALAVRHQTICGFRCSRIPPDLCLFLAQERKILSGLF